MSAPTPSRLDFQQVLQSSFDESTGRLRVDAQLSTSIIAPPGLEVSISAVDDNIAIRNSNNTNELLINADGSINVNTSGGGTSDVNLIQIAGTGTSVNNGIADAGTLRVAIASDNSPIIVDQGTSPWIISGTVTANAGTDLNTSALALEATQLLGNSTLTSILSTQTDKSQFTKITDGTDTALITASGELNVLSTAQPGVDLGDVTINNGSGGSAVNIQDGGNSITVDGSLGRTWVLDSSTDSVNIGNFPATQAVTQSTSPWVDNITQFGSNPVVTGTGTSGLGIPRVTVSNDSNILATQSGTWNITDITGTISLPTGASTSTNQTNGSQKTQLVDGSGTVNGPYQTISGTNYLPVVLAASGTTTSAVPSRTIQVGGSDGINLQTLSVDTTGKLNINNISGTISLPTGAATSANQTTANASLSSIDGKLADNYGSATTALRTASQIGNTTGAADFNFGTVGAQTLRVASQIGNATGAAAFGAGTTTAQVIRAVLPTDQTVIPVSDNSSSLTVDQSTASNLNAQVVGNVASGAADSGNPVRVAGKYNTTLPTYSDGNRAGLQSDLNGRLLTNSVHSDGFKTTYSATSTFSAANLATDIFTITGSATKTVRILRIGISATQTNNSVINLTLLKRSTANSGGTSTTLTNVPLDSNNAAATATVLSYTANPTTGTLVGDIQHIKYFVDIATKTTGSDPEKRVVFGDNFGQAVVLRGTSEVFAINLTGVTVAGNNFSIWIEWTEE